MRSPPERGSLVPGAQRSGSFGQSDEGRLLLGRSDHSAYVKRWSSVGRKDRPGG